MDLLLTLCFLKVNFSNVTESIKKTNILIMQILAGGNSELARPTFTCSKSIKILEKAVK